MLFECSIRKSIEGRGEDRRLCPSFAGSIHSERRADDHDPDPDGESLPLCPVDGGQQCVGSMLRSCSGDTPGGYRQGARFTVVAVVYGSIA
jgi:hypothetical protein